MLLKQWANCQCPARPPQHLASAALKELTPGTQEVSGQCCGTTLACQLVSARGELGGQHYSCLLVSAALESL